MKGLKIFTSLFLVFSFVFVISVFSQTAEGSMTNEPTEGAMTNDAMKDASSTVLEGETNRKSSAKDDEKSINVKSKIVKEFVVDDFQKGVNYDNWWFGSGTYGHIYIKPVPYLDDNIVCEIDYGFTTINDDRIWLAMNKMLSINDVRDYDALSIKVISGGYGGQFSINLVDSKKRKWTYANNDILLHKQEFELHIPLKRFLCPVDLSSLSSLEVAISYAGNLLEIPYSGKCWVDDIKFIKYKK